MVLEKIGADERVRDLFRLQAAAGTELGRISFASHEQYRVLLETAECDAVPAGRLRWADALPAVGDWVSARRVDAQLTLIEAVLPRRTQFSRRAAGRTVTEQVVAANIDLAVIVTGLDGDFNPRRMERYLVLAREGGAEPVIVLNKADVCDSVPEAVDAVTRIANGAQVLVLRARESVEVLKEIVRGRTVAFLGSSGAGKSTIANGLLGEERQPTGDVRAADSRKDWNGAILRLRDGTAIGSCRSSCGIRCWSRTWRRKRRRRIDGRRSRNRSGNTRSTSADWGGRRHALMCAACGNNRSLTFATQ